MIERERILQTFLKLARISSPSGHEEQVAAAITAHLANLGVACENDEHGNLLARVPGVGEPLLLTAHMDTVVPCDHVQPVVRDGVVYSDGSTILGGDDKAGVAIILEVVEALRATAWPTAPWSCSLPCERRSVWRVPGCSTRRGCRPARASAWMLAAMRASSWAAPLRRIRCS
jgi:acetylornithine deacetylase/succinyl-diaminopimelate desuccinylase-like protein